MNSLQPPKLDDRRFQDLVDEALRHIRQTCPEWTDLSPGDPGVVLVEAFAHMTETLIYRLNQLPERAYVEFLRLIGVKLQPPSAASVRLKLQLSRPLPHDLEIKRGTRITTKRMDAGSETPVFSVARTVTLAAGKTEAETTAYHGELVEAELAGKGSGQPGLTVNAAQPPIVAPCADELDLVVGVELAPGQGRSPASAIQYAGKTFGIWREVEHFAEARADDFVYTVDRVAGTIQFGPSLHTLAEQGGLADVPQALGAVPPEGAEIRLWYRRGGGIAGNVAANTLTVLKDTIPGLTVTNPAPAVGGTPVETLENALLRGPQQLRSLSRAVTARDFELLATQGAVSRAKAFTKASMWRHARPGTVAILLVPQLTLNPGEEHQITLSYLHGQEMEPTLQQIRETLNERRPLGVECEVNWVSYKTVHVAAKVVVTREEDPVEVRQRVIAALYRTICPKAISPTASDWPFGQPLRSWDIYKIIGSEPGVLSVEQLRLVANQVPDANVIALSADAFQPNTWYAGSGASAFRSVNDGRGWEMLQAFGDEQIILIKTYPDFGGSSQRNAGLVAVVTQPEGEKSSARLYLSKDCGENWQPGPQVQFRVNDLAWIERGGRPFLMLATEIGLYQLSLDADDVPEQILVDPDNQQLGFYAVATSQENARDGIVALAARGNRGVFLSMRGGDAGTFQPIKGLENELLRVLSIQQLGPHTFLWAGLAAPGDEAGKGCYRWRITRTGENPEGWVQFGDGWNAGSCMDLAFDKSMIFAATRRLGVMRLDLDRDKPAWQEPDVNCGLPLRGVGQLHPVQQVATSPLGGCLMASGLQGIYKSTDRGVSFEYCSAKEFSDELTLPKTWLFCSGRHEIEVVSEDAIP